MSEITDLRKTVNDMRDEFYDYFSGKIINSIYKDRIDRYSSEFWDFYRKRPVKDNTGGGGIKPNYWLFMLSKLLAPELVVESGVWKGQTSWLLRQANTAAEIHAFDINLKNLEYKDNTVFYHEHDWMSSYIINKAPDKGLVFFDDHVNQSRRVREAYERRFKWLVFDDNVPTDLIYRVGVPALPNIRMLFDSQLREGDIITWEIKGKVYSYVFKEEDTFGVRELIDYHLVFPTYTSTTLVKLKL